MLWLTWNNKWIYGVDVSPQMWLTLCNWHFVPWAWPWPCQILTFLYLRNAWSDSHKTKCEHIAWTLRLKGDWQLWLWASLWPWIFMKILDKFDPEMDEDHFYMQGGGKLSDTIAIDWSKAAEGSFTAQRCSCFNMLWDILFKLAAFNWPQITMAFDNGLAAIRCQTITWSNVDQIHERINASLSLHELQEHRWAVKDPLAPFDQ